MVDFLKNKLIEWSQLKGLFTFFLTKRGERNVWMSLINTSARALYLFRLDCQVADNQPEGYPEGMFKHCRTSPMGSIMPSLISVNC